MKYSTPRQLVLHMAKQEVGQSEYEIETDNPRIKMYHEYTLLGTKSSIRSPDEIPWCASFMAYVLESSGLPSTRSASALSYMTWGERTRTPTIGDLVVMARGAPGSGKGHVGFYMGRNRAKRTVNILGGNQTNSVKYTDFRDKRIISFRKLPEQFLFLPSYRHDI